MAEEEETGRGGALAAVGMSGPLGSAIASRILQHPIYAKSSIIHSTALAAKRNEATTPLIGA